MLRTKINFYEGRQFPQVKSKLGNKLIVGDTVCIGSESGPFRKSYLDGWSQEIFYIEHKINGTPMVYKLKNQADESIKGMF